MKTTLLVVSVIINIILLILLFFKSALNYILEERWMVRKITLISIILGIILVIITCCLYYYSSPQSLPSIVIGFLSALLILALIYYRFSQNPELKILSFNIEPENDKHGIIAKKEFLRSVDGQERVVVEPKSRWIFWKYIEYESRPFFFRVAFDVANLGLVGITVHEFRYKELRPNESSEFIKPIKDSEENKRRYLGPQERITLDFNYSRDFYYSRNDTPLKNKKYEFSVTVYAATMSIKKTLSVDISSDGKTISWSWS